MTLAAGPAAQLGRSPGVKVGLGETVITPKENVQMAGFARSQVSTGVHDDLHAMSLVMEDGDGYSPEAERTCIESSLELIRRTGEGNHDNSPQAPAKPAE